MKHEKKKKEKKTDRRVERTRTALHEALVALLLERGWDDVSVFDVCDRANVGRSTFYTHFADREDLLLSGFEHLKRELRAARHADAGERKGLRFSRALLEHVAAHRRLFRALVGKRAGQTVVRRFREVVLEMTLEELPRHLTGVERTTTALYLAGGLFEVLSWWLDARAGVDLDDVDARLQRFADKVLRPS